MKVVILCGGRGTRLREETEFRPKPMLPIGNRPILWHIMKLYAHHRFADFVLCLGYKGHIIKEYFLNYKIMTHDYALRLGDPSSVKFLPGDDCPEGDWWVTFAETGEDAMTGARVKRIERYIDSDTFMLTYGDGVADVNLSALVNFHREHGKIATVTAVRPSGRFGEIEVAANGMVASFAEKPQARGGLINGGFFVFNRRVFDYLEDDDSFALEGKPLERLTKEGQLVAFVHDGFWQPMDTYRELSMLNAMWERGEAPWAVWREGRE